CLLYAFVGVCLAAKSGGGERLSNKINISTGCTSLLFLIFMECSVLTAASAPYGQSPPVGGSLTLPSTTSSVPTTLCHDTTFRSPGSIAAQQQERVSLAGIGHSRRRSNVRSQGRPDQRDAF